MVEKKGTSVVVMARRLGAAPSGSGFGDPTAQAGARRPVKFMKGRADGNPSARRVLPLWRP